MHPLQITHVEFNANGLVKVITANGDIKTVTAEFLNACTGCDVHTLSGSIGQIWD